MNVIQILAPTNDSTGVNIDSFHNKLHDMIDQLPSKDVNIVMGDVNAHFGRTTLDTNK